MNYADQGKAFLNAFWEDCSDEAEKIWTWANKFAELDLDKKKEGSDLDEFNAHRFLESLKETKTVREMRKEITEADMDFNKRLALIEYCMWKYKKNVAEFVKIPQGGRKEEIDEANRMLDAVSEAFAQADARAQEAKAALASARKSEAEAKARETEALAREKEAKASEKQAVSDEESAKKAEAASQQAAADAKAQEDDAKAREEELRAAQSELEAALAELKAQEDAYNNKTADLKKKSETGGIVSRNRAKNELAQHLGEDPLPLRRAKITQEAAVKKAERATTAAADARAKATAAAAEADKRAAEASEAAQRATEARVAATNARTAAEQAASAASAARAQAEEDRKKSEEAQAAADAAVEEAREKVAEAEAYLAEVKSRIPHGSSWWLERDLAEKKKYLPKRKQ
eukprot:TRINITY_DN12264_c0_g1_i1.p1 TRINITY_DN12264_c0_g1~~TRINITY_DN12264_c0_g1_i1.p1  ORF type:complete len:404 (+),score=162.31 TRINITY_DN12264_c0_g1_i1:50-1261(+)